MCDVGYLCLSALLTFAFCGTFLTVNSTDMSLCFMVIFSFLAVFTMYSYIFMLIDCSLGTMDVLSAAVSVVLILVLALNIIGCVLACRERPMNS